MEEKEARFIYFEGELVILNSKQSTEKLTKSIEKSIKRQLSKIGCQLNIYRVIEQL